MQVDPVQSGDPSLLQPVDLVQAHCVNHGHPIDVYREGTPGTRYAQESLTFTRQPRPGRCFIKIPPPRCVTWDTLTLVSSFMFGFPSEPLSTVVYTQERPAASARSPSRTRDLRLGISGVARPAHLGHDIPDTTSNLRPPPLLRGRTRAGTRSDPPCSPTASTAWPTQRFAAPTKRTLTPTSGLRILPAGPGRVPSPWLCAACPGQDAYVPEHSPWPRAHCSWVSHRHRPPRSPWNRRTWRACVSAPTPSPRSTKANCATWKASWRRPSVPRPAQKAPVRMSRRPRNRFVPWPLPPTPAVGWTRPCHCLSRPTPRKSSTVQ